METNDHMIVLASSPIYIHLSTIMAILIMKPLLSIVVGLNFPTWSFPLLLSGKLTRLCKSSRSEAAKLPGYVSNWLNCGLLTQ